MNNLNVVGWLAINWIWRCCKADKLALLGNLKIVKEACM